MELAITLWEFPSADFADWCQLVGEPAVGSYAEYLALLDRVQADCEDQGRTVRRVKMTVRQMRDALAEEHMDNTPDNRAAIVGLHEIRGRK
jgi:hypothetical protein